MTTKPHKKFRRPQQQPETLEPETPKSTKKRAYKGLFSDGKWLCNCEPRQELSLLKVKNHGQNHGRLYYKCFDKCRLFLWHDDAVARETGLAPTTPSKDESKEDTEPQPPKTPSFTQRVLTSYGYPLTPSRRQSDVDTSFTGDSNGGDLGPSSDEDGSESDVDLISTPTRARVSAPALAATEPLTSSKRKRDVFEEDEFSDFGSDQEREMIEIGEKSAEKFEAQKRRYTTPCDARTTDIISGLPTPSVARTLFRENKRQKHVSFEESSSSVAPLSTPPSVSSQTRAAPPSTPQADSCDVTDEVMRLLRDQNVNPSVLRSIQGVLSISARRAKGIALGREAAKEALKARNEKVALLEEQIAILEEREQAHRNQMTNIKAGLMKMYEEN